MRRRRRSGGQIQDIDTVATTTCQKYRKKERKKERIFSVKS